MTDVVLLAPRRRDWDHRDMLWHHSRSVWAELFPDFPIVEGHHDVGPFNRSAAINRAAALAGNWQVAVIIDCDVLPSKEGVLDAIAHAVLTGGPAAGHTGRKNLNQRGTKLVMDGFKGSWERLIGSRHDKCISGAFVVTRELWDKLGGFDESFVGWGFEDTAFEAACETVSGRALYRAQADLWHLWHRTSPEHNTRLPNYIQNRNRRDRYLKARFDDHAMAQLLDEAAAHRFVVPSRPEVTFSQDVKIPRVLHRTVPALTSAEVERFWEMAKDLHPDWVCYTWRDPLDPEKWPMTSYLWDQCSSGAQKAGLIRLEALWHHGGVYIDSDVELYRSLEPLLDLQGFAAWEDRRCAPDAVMGFKPQHPAVGTMIDRARHAVEEGLGAWNSGPGVSTDILPRRNDVLLLPPGSFYPYHYKQKHKRSEDHRANPWTFGAHHWAHSWDGK